MWPFSRRESCVAAPRQLSLRSRSRALTDGPVGESVDSHFADREPTIQKPFWLVYRPTHIMTRMTQGTTCTRTRRVSAERSRCCGIRWRSNGRGQNALICRGGKLRDPSRRDSLSRHPASPHRAIKWGSLSLSSDFAQSFECRSLSTLIVEPAQIRALSGTMGAPKRGTELGS